ncbi:MAG: TIGR02597 family protein [Verrucomicrobiota bacterium]
MKPIIPFALLGALFAVGSASANNTDPVGYLTLGNTTALPDLPNNTDILVSVSLVQPTEFSGEVDSVASQVITVSGTPGWADDQWLPVDPATDDPYVITSDSGVLGLIVDNDGNTVTIDGAFDISSLAATDGLVIRKATTLQNFFAGNTVPSGLEVQLQSGSGVGTNLAFDVIYTNFGTWFDAGFGAADTAVLYPGEAFIIRNTTGSDMGSLVVTGEVQLQNSSALLAGGAGQQDTPFGYTSPVGETLADAGLVGASGDELLEYDNTATGINKAAAAVYTSFGGAEWFDAGFTDVKDTLELGSGNGFVYRRAAGAGDYDFSDQPNFVPTL